MRLKTSLYNPRTNTLASLPGVTKQSYSKTNDPTEAGAELHVSTPASPETQVSQPSVATKLHCPQFAPYQFKKGVSGNPGGVPKIKPITEIWKEIVETPAEREAIKKAAIAIIAARDGVTVAMLKEMTDRLEGRAVSADDSDREPLSVNIGIEILGNLAAK